MRKLTYYVAATLDGFIAAPDGGDPTDQSYFAVTPDLVELIATQFPETLPAPARDAMGHLRAGAGLRHGARGSGLLRARSGGRT